MVLAAQANNPLDAETQKQIAETVQKKKDNRLSPTSVEKHLTATNAEVKESLSNILYWRKHEAVKTDEECAERLDEFFTRMNETGEIPTVEKMALALGVSRQAVWQWETGLYGTPERQKMIKKAKEILAALDAELVSKGKIPQVTYIFRAKNFYGMRDQAEVVITPNNPLGSETSAEEIQKRLEADIPIEGEFTET